MPGLLTANSPVQIGGLAIHNPMATPNAYAGGNNPAPAAVVNNGAGGGGGGGGGGGNNGNNNNNTTPPNPGVPAAPAGPTPAQITAQNNYNNTYGADMTGIASNISAGASTYGQGIMDAFNGTGGFGDRQSTIDSSGIQNQLSEDQGMQGVRDMVNNGIQGGGVMLDNAGAGTSSASDALARAYGVEGRQQASSVGSQYQGGLATIGVNQGQLNSDENNYVAVDAPANKAIAVNSIVQSATSALTYLNLMAANTTDPAQLGDISAKIAQIKSEATTALTNYDGSLASQMTAHTGMTQPTIQSTAASRFAAGTAPASEFNYTSTAPATIQGTGPAASNLPIYVSPSNKTNIPATA